MKITSYKCDRCGAALGEDGVALDKNRLASTIRLLDALSLSGREKKSLCIL